MAQRPKGVLVYTRGLLAVARDFPSRRAELELGGNLLLAGDPLTTKRAGKLSLPANSAARMRLRD
jgi:hypothetical protein